MYKDSVMQSPSLTSLRDPRDHSIHHGLHQAVRAPGITRSMSGIRRLRSDESWIEVSSQPSSSSLSSIATDDRSTAIRAQEALRRRRRLNRTTSLPYEVRLRSASTAGSSQEEYEESESESDRIMTSSNEGIGQLSEGASPLAQISSASEQDEEEEDEDENATALGVTTAEQPFTPQPNAFSHPPRSPRHTHSAEGRTSYFPAPKPPAHRPARSYPTDRTRSHTPYNMISPSHQADHDAALRASLSTLLSCAAAARGLPKRENPPALPKRPTAEPTRESGPTALRMGPESVLLGQSPEAPRSTARKRSAGDLRAATSNEKGKRKASTSQTRRETRKKQKASVDEMTVSPTLMTWVMSAGVVVLFSAISFSAGYVVGKEVGRMEGGFAHGGQGITSSKDVGRGLRRLRMGSSATLIRV